LINVNKTYLTKPCMIVVLANVCRGFVLIKNLARADVQNWRLLLRSRNEDALSRQRGRLARRDRRG
jgi:hypothetical protein